MIKLLFFFGMGAVVGSFLNVCISRMPKGESIVMPGSHCPHCKKPIAWYDNVPLLSFLILRGKCRQCREKISPRYFGVELVSGILWMFLGSTYPVGGTLAAGLLFFSILLCVTITDLETGYIPDKLTLPGILAGLILSALAPELVGQAIWQFGIWESLLGILAGGGLLLVTGYLGDFIFKTETMGGGDIKLLALIGAFLGWQKVIFVFLFSPVAAVPFGLYAKYSKRAQTIPYGPFLAITGAIFFLYGKAILSWIFLS